MQLAAHIKPLSKNLRVSSRVTIQNPRPRKYASDAERQKAFRERQAVIQVRVKPETVETFDRIASTLGYTRQEVVYALLMSGLNNNRNWQQTGIPGFRMPRYEDNPMKKKPTPAQLAARERFAEMARSGAFKRGKNPAKKTVSQKISQLTREGYPQRQAVAIALNEERKGKVKRNPSRREGLGFEGYDPYGSRDNLDEYRQKSDAELRYIMKDAGEAAKAQRGMSSEAKYLDQVNDAATVLYERKIAREKAIATSSKKIGKREASAINRLLSGRGGNPSEREERKPRVVLITNPKGRDNMKYAYALVLDDGGFTYGMDARTPVTFEFSQRDRKRGVYTSYQLPSAAVNNPGFQAMVKSLPGQQYIGTLTELRSLVKKFM
ncbi:MAG: hypothetical protein EB116_10785 [Betaproteobacteria bacterium]|nr:hypothetical protein [Betaproteobacteria bacterium]